ncbi:MAG: hypothetical protein JXQ76_03790 [Campylobacterales bacterium]|nr:hypothetical protein [Campylobacterales bacterium]
MISLNIDVKESAYDKIIYLLSHLKDDVIIKTHPFVSKDTVIQDTNKLKTLQRLSTLDKLVAQSNNQITLTRELAIDTDGMMDDISR